MKISLAFLTATLLFMTWLGQVQLGSLDYRYKRRGAPPPPRPPSIPQYLKKWDQHRLDQHRPDQHRPDQHRPDQHRPDQHRPDQHRPDQHRPDLHRPPRGSPPRPQRPIIPMQMVSDFMVPPVVPSVLSLGPPVVKSIGPPVGPPVGPPLVLPVGKPIGPPIRPTPTPVRNYWKYTKTPIQTIPEKPFHFSPPISNTHEYDYHIQTNNIPTHNIPIKQLGEKGPIHTIPAPNLSLADKPIIVEEVRSEPKRQPPQQQPQKQAPQYQVTEPNEGFTKNSQKHFREQQNYYSPEIFSNVPQSQNYERFQQPHVDKQPVAQSFINVQDESPFSSKELYQLLNSQLQQQQQQQLYEIPSLPQALVQQPQQLQQQQLQQQQLQQQQLQQQQLEQIPSYIDYQSMLAQSQLFQAEQPYLNQLQNSIPNQNSRDNNQGQFHSFTSERHSQGNFARPDDQSTFITADYNLKAEDANSASYSVLEESNKSEPNLPYVQEVFNLNEENTGNKVEQNIKNTQGENDSNKKEEEKIGNIDSEYYATLPNRQAAETLASLQAAGKVNSNLMQVLPQQRPQIVKVNQGTPLDIYVPDTHSFGNHEVQSSEPSKNNYGNRGGNQEDNISDENSEEYEDGSIPENESLDEPGDTSRINQQARSNLEAFGNRIRPKQKQ